jgi:hypothetical protein
MVSLRSARPRPCARVSGLNAAGLAALVDAMQTHLASLHGVLAAAARQPLPEYHGMVPIHAPHFVGRVHELWNLHAN